MCGFATALWKINVLHYNFSNKTILLNMCSNVCIYMCIYIVCTNNNCQVISFSSTSYKKKEKKYYDYIQRHNKLPHCCKSGAFLLFILKTLKVSTLYFEYKIMNGMLEWIPVWVYLYYSTNIIKRAAEWINEKFNFFREAHSRIVRSLKAWQEFWS